MNYEDILNTFQMNINSLRTFVHYVQPSLEHKQDEFNNENGNLLAAISILADSKLKPEKYIEETDSLKKLEKEMEENLDFKFNTEETEDGYRLSMSRCKFSEKVVSTLKERKLVHGQIDILYRTSLINLVVFLELLISNLLRKRLYDYPEMFGIQNKSLTLLDIRNMGSLDEAEEYLIEKEIENIMRGSLNDWCNYFKEKLKLKFKCINDFKEELIEIFQRRNLYVHNDGIVNKIYLSNVNENQRIKIKNGEKLNIDLIYIDNAINTIEKAGSLIAIEIWKNSEKCSAERVDIISEIAYDHMLNERWFNAEALYKSLLLENKVANEDRSRFQINYWQCFKWTGRINIIKEDLEKDYSDKMIDFKLCLYALKDEYDEFFKLLPDAFPKLIKLSELTTWPVFREINKTDKFKEFIESHKPKVKQIKNLKIVKLEK